MGHFTTSGKRYRELDDLPGFAGVDLTITAPVPGFTQTAPEWIGDRQFLYWDTGRRLTGRRSVRWTFNHPGNWTQWNAYAWYGVPGTGPGSNAYGVDAHWIGDGPIDPTPIDGPGSTFVNGPGSTLAWPLSGNDHVFSTQWGAATVHAKPHLSKNLGAPQLDFANWSQLVWGGDGGGVFDENDDGIDASHPALGIASLGSQNITLPQNSGGFLVASYVQPNKSTVILRPILEEIIAALRNPGKIPPVGDPSPEDILRLRLLADSIDVASGQPVPQGDAFASILQAAKKMTQAELKRTIAGTKATLRRGEAALKTLEAEVKNAGGRKGQ